MNWIDTVAPTVLTAIPLGICFIKEGRLIQLLGHSNADPLTLVRSTGVRQLCLILVSNGSVDQIQAEVTLLVNRYDTLFQKPKGLPPRRKCDHAIELLLGSNPVKLRPYRYSFEQTNTIEETKIGGRAGSEGSFKSKLAGVIHRNSILRPGRNLKFSIVEAMEMTTANSIQWDRVKELVELAQERNTDPLIWTMQLSSMLNSVGISLPSIEVEEILVSHICWYNNVPHAWKLLERALTAKIAPPLFVLALLSTRSFLLPFNYY
ncbi:hypothetical protein FXO38_09934 [Capsicum annuum]|nr:hypothetical protein FXO38_09934 [Capsicum annuum]